MTPVLRLYNTATRRIEPFEPLEPGRVRMYCCGPTVYDYAHIGNLRTYFFEDILRRTLELIGYRVQHVMNVTDVGHLQSDADYGDDKMQIAALRERKSPWNVARFYEEQFFRHTDMLRIRRPSLVCRATEHIDDMIAMIQAIIARGHAYECAGNVYFDVSSFPRYADFAGLDLSAQESTTRVEPDPNKHNQSDFVLWFSTSKYPNQIMKWPSPWGVGFPGWHIECSAMASRYLGQKFDIHCGGIDHIAVHHTNEIAQSESCFPPPWVRYWLHGEFLELDSGKMSKSSGGFLHLDQLVADGFSPIAYRYLLLTAHYRSRIKFSYESLTSAQRAVSSLENLVRSWRRDAQGTDPTELRSQLVGDMREQFLNALGEDLHVPEALAHAWKIARSSDLSPHEKFTLFRFFDQVFGLQIESKKTVELTETQRRMISEREEARHRKDWKNADLLRDALLADGIRLRDHTGGTEWERVELDPGSTDAADR